MCEAMVSVIEKLTVLYFNYNGAKIRELGIRRALTRLLTGVSVSRSSVKWHLALVLRMSYQ